MGGVLFSWVGKRDLELGLDDRAGALASTLEADLDLSAAVVLRDPGRGLFAPESQARFEQWLRSRVDLPIEFVDVELDHPMHFAQIYDAAWAAVEQHLASGATPTFNLSSGTPAMAAVWILMGRGALPVEARLTNSSERGGVVLADVPFDIHATFLPQLRRSAEIRIGEVAAGAPLPEFEGLAYRSPEMEAVLARAMMLARHELQLPVLIQGETGTGKSVLANEIHRASPRSKGPFQALNCGAIPRELLESVLFGHKKGAFSGATQDQAGLFEAANGGTLFLDEIAELLPEHQVKVLRVVEDGEVMRVGDPKTRKADVRLITATHRDLAALGGEGSFREDLYYRLAVTVLHLPALRERAGDLDLLTDTILERLGKDRGRGGAFRITAGARSKLARHSWPGNVRELQNTLARAAVYCAGAEIDIEHVELRPTTRPGAADGVLDRRLGENLRLQDILDEVKRHYLTRALEEAGGVKREAARLVGLNRQTYNDWMAKVGAEGPD